MTEKEFGVHLRQIDATIANLCASTAKLVAKTEKRIAETSQISMEARLYLRVVGSGAALAILAIAKLLL